jgi:hypothetical protein
VVVEGLRPLALHLLSIGACTYVSIDCVRLGHTLSLQGIQTSGQGRKTAKRIIWSQHIDCIIIMRIIRGSRVNKMGDTQADMPMSRFSVYVSRAGRRHARRSKTRCGDVASS